MAAQFEHRAAIIIPFFRLMDLIRQAAHRTDGFAMTFQKGVQACHPKATLMNCVFFYARSFEKVTKTAAPYTRINLVGSTGVPNQARTCQSSNSTDNGSFSS